MFKIIALILLLFIFFFSILRYGFKIDYIRGESVLQGEIENRKYIDRAKIIESSDDALNVRLNMLDSAEEKVDIAYYKIDDSRSSKVFIAKIFELADRGVKVRIYLDGILNSLKGDVKDAKYAFGVHENIEYRLHEPFQLLKPWTYNNRLHDKIIIVDDKLTLNGGRNIGDRFLASDRSGRSYVFDRDILIYNEEGLKESVINEIQNYYERLWNSDSSVDFTSSLTEKEKVKGKNFIKNLKKEVKNMNIEEFSHLHKLDWIEYTKPIRNSEFIHNSLDTNKLEVPRAYLGILELAESAKEEVIIQSPYIILSSNMKRVRDNYDIDLKNIKILTNSYYSTPNILAISGYRHIRKDIVDNVEKVYEYHGKDSIHGKSYIFDEQVSIIGSFNLDPRSAYLSTESYLIVYDYDFSKDLKENMNELKLNSLKVGKNYKYSEEVKEHKTLKYKIKKLLIFIISIFTYFFDYLL